MNSRRVTMTTRLPRKLKKRIKKAVWRSKPWVRVDHYIPFCGINHEVLAASAEQPGDLISIRESITRAIAEINAMPQLDFDAVYISEDSWNAAIGTEREKDLRIILEPPDPATYPFHVRKP